MEIFQQLIWDLGELTNIALHVDNNQACNILLDDKLEIQLQMDNHHEFLVMYGYLGEISPGRYREDVFKEALKFNFSSSFFGHLAFYEKKNQLILQKNLPAENLKAEVLLQNLEEFIEESKEWYNTFKNGGTVPIKYKTSSPFKPPFSI